jgi:rare lipoprotein A
VSRGSGLAVAASFVLGAGALLSGCASRVEVPEGQRGAVVNPSANPSANASARSQRGNPPFYNVLGKRYFVLPTSDGYHERGVASWYGPDFHKQMTSSGDRYDMYGMTAAHKTLPLPTWVEVTNLENGRRVVVKVNDRGPFVKGRIIDLSYSAAKALDMIRAGTARVEVRALGPAPQIASTYAAAAPQMAAAPPFAAPQTASASPAAVSRSGAAAASSAEAPAAKGRRRGGGLTLISEAAADEIAASERIPAPAGVTQHLFVQVGAFSSRQNAARVVDGLKARGYANAFMSSDTDGLNRVRVGPLADAAEFDRVSNGLRGLGYADTRLVAE